MRRPLPAQGLIQGSSTVQSDAIACAKLNKANGQSVTLTNSNVVLGMWSTSTHAFTSGGTSPNAVQVTVPLTASGGNAVNMFFGRVLGVNSMNVSASAVATVGRWDVVIVIDRSSSFSLDLAQAVLGIQTILSDLKTYSPSSYMGVVSFNGVAYTNASLQQVGTNYSALTTAITGIVDCSVGGPPCSGSDLAAGMAGGIALFSASGYSPPTGTRKAIIFISDGASSITSVCLNKNLTDAQDNSLCATEAANAYKNSGISVYSLLYYHGSDSQTDISAMEALIQGNGVFINEPNASQLTADIESMLDGNFSMALVQ